MTDLKLLLLARNAGFEAALLPAEQVPMDGKFRPFCEENRCGQYNANYSCPPACGTVEEMGQRIRAGKTALVLKSVWPIESYEDVSAIQHGKRTHNQNMLQLNQQLQAGGSGGLCVGGSCCCLCTPCRMKTGEPCLYPQLRFSCMSAYCVDVAELAGRCGMEFSWDQKKLSVYSMIVLP